VLRYRLHPAAVRPARFQYLPQVLPVIAFAAVRVELFVGRKVHRGPTLPIGMRGVMVVVGGVVMMEAIVIEHVEHVEDSILGLARGVEVVLVAICRRCGLWMGLPRRSRRALRRGFAVGIGDTV